MIFITWYKKAIKQRRINLNNNIYSYSAQKRLVMQVIKAPIRKTVMLIQLQILNSIIRFGTYMMKKI